VCESLTNATVERRFCESPEAHSLAANKRTHPNHSDDRRVVEVDHPGGQMDGLRALLIITPSCTPTDTPRCASFIES
jgi:hypothetical protein